ncbi:TnsA endonuclease N-terminal domain-containing protein [Paraburkholderia sp. GAS334]|uniref:TnsA endonuclease N-terminal domain-containing protein n=1 Tax=Paraburkholderia sp. GAS334 TaxID=3035131 RepID=UPI003D19A841
MLLKAADHLSPYQLLVCPDLPAVDGRGVPNGMKYRSFLDATTATTSLANVTWGYISSRGYELLSFLERSVHYWLHLQPDVVDWREQYPFFDPNEVARYMRTGKRVPRNKVPTLDFVYTLAANDNQPYRSGAISVKSKEELKLAATWRRMEREQAFCAQHGWSWRMITEEQMPTSKGRACREVVLWAQYSEIAADADSARLLAALVRKSANGHDSFEDVLSDSALQLGCTLNDAYTFFAVACISKLLFLDLSKFRNIHSPLVLL